MQSIYRFTFLLVITVAALTARAQVDSVITTVVITPADSIKPLNFDTVAQRIANNAIPYNTLALRTQMSWNDGQIEQDFMGSIRMQKDSLVWASLFGPFNIEGARLLITPDTFRLINRLAAEYVTKPFNFLERWLYVPVSFTMLQQLLAGERLSINEKAWSLTTEDSLPVLYYETDKLQQKVWVNPVNYTITKILLKDKMLKQSIGVTFDAYNDLNGKPFSYKRSIEIVRDTAVMSLGMHISKVSLNEDLQYPFEVSDKYKKIE